MGLMALPGRLLRKEPGLFRTDEQECQKPVEMAQPLAYFTPHPYAFVSGTFTGWCALSAERASST